ncbi:MAG: rod shape-determining protein RodA [Candidatus Anaerobiospirillum merdipullorum]|uniref:Peptidoglycan glycosyltransferase MrdB n=1 Tax=Candidatus Anaerobiospirillum merdipullorum TaxID=2838450 RepID=A0A9E2NT10_9GAMM|nr:rod shape-determining protein RodA [Candidatus Anaerobiospirillum merdipullorum]
MLDEKKQDLNELGRAPTSPFVRWHIDVQLMLGFVMTLLISLFVLYSASGQHPDMLLRQLMRTGLAFIVMIVVAQLPPRFYGKSAIYLYIVGIILLILVEVVGDISKGAQRWLDLGFARVQPSEIFKVVMPLLISAFLARGGLPPRFGSVVIAFVLIAIPFALILHQPDLGTAGLIAISGFIPIFIAGMSLWWLVVGGVAAAAVLPVMWNFVLHDYQKQRVLTLINPESDPLGAGYHIIQSKIAIGSGGIFGKGWLQGSQSQLDFLPEPHTDFIFAVLAEETGLIGFLILLAVYSYIILRCIIISLNAQTNFERILAATFTFTFACYIFINIGMVSGILPVVGVPLPMISYGGTSMITLAVSFGIIMSIHTHKRSLTFRS